MYVIQAENINEAWLVAGVLARNDRSWWLNYPSRANAAGDMTHEFKMPVTTVYRSPEQCVLFSANRDANPFFHLFEALWILAGRSDVTFLSYFLPRMMQFSDDGLVFHGAYGERLQEPLDHCILALNKDRSTRRAFAPIFDPGRDNANLGTRDLPCNTGVAFRVREGKLCATVFNRSNDIVWGKYGANAVQFSFILQYVAMYTGLPVGTLTQVTNSFHYYTGQREMLLREEGSLMDPYNSSSAATMFMGIQSSTPLIPVSLREMADPAGFEADLEAFFQMFDNGREKEPDYRSELFNYIIAPAFKAFRSYALFRQMKDSPDGGRDAIAEALTTLEEMPLLSDWRVAMRLWLLRRAEARFKGRST